MQFHQSNPKDPVVRPRLVQDLQRPHYVFVWPESRLKRDYFSQELAKILRSFENVPSSAFGFLISFFLYYKGLWYESSNGGIHNAIKIDLVKIWSKFLNTLVHFLLKIDTIIKLSKDKISTIELFLKYMVLGKFL